MAFLDNGRPTAVCVCVCALRWHVQGTSIFNGFTPGQKWICSSPPSEHRRWDEDTCSLYFYFINCRRQLHTVSTVIGRPGASPALAVWQWVCTFRFQCFQIQFIVLESLWTASLEKTRARLRQHLGKTMRLPEFRDNMCFSSRCSERS